MRQNLRARLICLTLLFCTAPLVSCQSSGSEQQKEDQTVVGSPPSEEDDPFRIIQTPEDAEEAPRKGTIGSGETPDSAATEPADPQGPPPESKGPEEHQCFSCVRLCPTDDNGEFVDGECGAGGEDVICGWSVHPDRTIARRTARAECDGALDLTRQMPTWSKIEGQCPQASCR